MKIWLFVVFLGAINLAAFSVGAALIGGYAYLGRVEGERYFVGVEDAYLPVSRAVFLYSLWHGYSQAMTALPALFGAWLLWKWRLLPDRAMADSREAIEPMTAREVWLSCQGN